MTEAWLQNLKVGDEVYINYSGSFRLAKVLRITMKQLVVSSRLNLVGEVYEERYRRDSGRACGGDAGCQNYLEEATPELRERVRLYNFRRSVSDALKSVTIPTDKANLEALYLAIKPYLPLNPPKTAYMKLPVQSEMLRQNTLGSTWSEW